jgi:glycosyltransferase involved in cell wall biosynthesis
VRLLLITPKVDPTDNLFGHVNSWAIALAQRVERLYVVALWPGRPDLPKNARFSTLGKAAGNPGPGSLAARASWLVRLQRIVARLALRGEIDAVLAHMGPVFAVAATPIARLAGIPTFLWYAHGHVSPLLRLAHLLTAGVGTSTPEGFRIASERVTITGQGIDLDRFRPTDAPVTSPRLLSVGRFSPIKAYETILEAVARPAVSTRADLTVELLGGVHSQTEAAYLDSLRERARRLTVSERVRFVEGLPYAEIVPTYQRASLFATASATGSMDKVVLEAAACGLPPIVCNDACRQLYGDLWPALSFAHRDDVAGLSAQLAAWLDRTAAERRGAALALRARIEAAHSVDHWADSVIGMIERGIAAQRHLA